MVAQNQVEMDLISHNSTCDITLKHTINMSTLQKTNILKYLPLNAVTITYPNIITKLDTNIIAH